MCIVHSTLRDATTPYRERYLPYEKTDFHSNNLNRIEYQCAGNYDGLE